MIRAIVGLSMREQLALADMIEQDTLERDRAAHRYIEQHVAEYLGYARAIEPDRRNWRQVWDRLAFAILTANAETHNALAAFREARTYRSAGWPRCTVPGIVPDRVRYVNALPKGKWTLHLLRTHRETWRQYRQRLMQLDGLAMTKASYAACLLYPLAANVACLDTWMLKLLKADTSRFVYCPPDEYLKLEDQVRVIAGRHKVSVALAQWMLWDFIRSGRPTPQRFFD